MNVSTSAYERSHGKPRGYGQWAFCLKGDYDRADYLDYMVWYTGKFSDAKRSAVAYFSARMVVDDVVVCP